MYICPSLRCGAYISNHNYFWRAEMNYDIRVNTCMILCSRMNKKFWYTALHMTLVQKINNII